MGSRNPSSLPMAVLEQPTDAFAALDGAVTSTNLTRRGEEYEEDEGALPLVRSVRVVTLAEALEGSSREA